MDFLTLLATDARLSWRGIVGLESTETGTSARRLTPFARELFPSGEGDALWQRAAMPASVRLVFQTDSTVIGGHYAPSADLKPLDLFCDGEFVASQTLGGDGEFRFENLPAHLVTVELWLPHFGVFTLRDLFLAPNSTINSVTDERPKWVTYGSSITRFR